MIGAMGMSGIIEMIESNEQSRRETVATTVRMSEEISAQIEGLVDYLDTTKNEVMINLLKTGLDQAYKHIENMNTESFEGTTKGEKSYFLLNTNKSNNIDDQKRMLKEGRAEAFSEPWKDYIKKIKEGDIVFLYGNGEGIVAYGVATGKVENGYRYDDEKQDPSCYQILKEFKPLSKPIKANDIRKALDKKIPFLKTLITIKEGDKLLKFIKK